jgi:methylated-DNA-protein-cysteine methyltransferase related protein
VTSSMHQFDQAVWKVVSGIPAGQVLGYGEVARAAGFPRHARMVSKAMGRSPEPLPWYRVVRSNRTLAFEVGGQAYKRQKELLEAEGVQVIGVKVTPVAVSDKDDLDSVLWGPEGS